MTQIFAEDGTATGVTVLAVGPCVVCQVRKQDQDGYNAIQLGFEDVRDKRVTKPLLGHFKKADVAPKRFLREERLAEEPTHSVGDVIKADVFAAGDYVDVVGTSKGRGFSGTIKRHGFQRGPETHGSMNVRAPGSISTKRRGPLFKGKRMPGRYGVDRTTVKNLRVVDVDADKNLLLVAGSVPGPKNGFVQVQTARTAPVKAAS
jgi:large subunit ribosomal protein L3